MEVARVIPAHFPATGSPSDGREDERGHPPCVWEDKEKWFDDSRVPTTQDETQRGERSFLRLTPRIHTVSHLRQTPAGFGVETDELGPRCTWTGGHGTAGAVQRRCTVGEARMGVSWTWVTAWCPTVPHEHTREQGWPSGNEPTHQGSPQGNGESADNGSVMARP